MDRLRSGFLGGKEHIYRSYASWNLLKNDHSVFGTNFFLKCCSYSQAWLLFTLFLLAIPFPIGTIRCLAFLMVIELFQKVPGKVYKTFGLPQQTKMEGLGRLFNEQLFTIKLPVGLSRCSCLPLPLKSTEA
jgi:hypothetical protein